MENLSKKMVKVTYFHEDRKFGKKYSIISKSYFINGKLTFNKARKLIKRFSRELKTPTLFDFFPDEITATDDKIIITDGLWYSYIVELVEVERMKKLNENERFVKVIYSYEDKKFSKSYFIKGNLTYNKAKNLIERFSREYGTPRVSNLIIDTPIVDGKITATDGWCNYVVEFVESNDLT